MPRLRARFSPQRQRRLIHRHAYRFHLDSDAGVVEVLDFYHASQHLWTLGEARHGQKEAARPWVEKQLHQLRHGRHTAALRTIAGLWAGRGAAGAEIRREQNYFAEHARRLNYQAVAARGWAIGSGPVESACLHRQGRFNRSGQFWTPPGQQRLCALIEARQNGHWDALRIHQTGEHFGYTRLF